MFNSKIKFRLWPVALLYAIILTMSVGTTTAQDDPFLLEEADGRPAISDDGRFVVFPSRKSRLVTNDTDYQYDIFIRDGLEQITKQVSLAYTEGEASNGKSFWPDMSGDGRYVVFVSEASNLVPNDSNGVSDIFLYDQETEQLTRISVASDGSEGDRASATPAISNNGRFITFSSDATNLIPNDTNNDEDIFVYDREHAALTRASVNSDGEEGDSNSQMPAISSDGRFVVFQSWACNFTTAGCEGWQVYRHDRQSGETILVSVALDGAPGDDKSVTPVVSDNGRFVAFRSEADNLVTGDPPNWRQIYVRDLDQNVTKRVSVSNSGDAGNYRSAMPTLDSSGRYIAFTSEANNLVVAETRGFHIFVHDQETGETTLASVSKKGETANGWSFNPNFRSDGRSLTFLSQASNLALGDSSGTDVFVRDQATGEVDRASIDHDWLEGKGGGYSPAISGDGSIVAFVSEANNLVPYDDNGLDIFLYELANPKLQRLLASKGGLTGSGHVPFVVPHFSENGRFIAFYNRADYLVPNDTNGVEDVFLHDRDTGETILVSVASDGSQGNNESNQPSLSADGQTIAFASVASNLVAGDNNQVVDVFVHQRSSGETIRVSVDSAGNEGNSYSSNPFLSPNGRYVVFASYATNLVSDDTNEEPDSFVHDLVTGETRRISVASDGTEGNYGGGFYPSSSYDGHTILFTSFSNNLVANDTNNQRDLFLHDLVTGVTTRPILTSDGSEPNGHTAKAIISGNGRFLVFESEASNLVPNDNNDIPDTFLHDLTTSETTRLTVAPDGSDANAWDYDLSFSIDHDGRFVVFSTFASNLVPDDTNGVTDVFLLDRETGERKLISSGSPIPASPTFNSYLPLVQRP